MNSLKIKQMYLVTTPNVLLNQDFEVVTKSANSNENKFMTSKICVHLQGLLL